MDKIRKFKYIILIMLIVFGFIFYWYSYRPNHIRKECSIHSFSIVDGKGQFSGDIRTVSDAQYKLCLRQNGFDY